MPLGPIGPIAPISVTPPAGEQIGQGIASLAQLPDMIQQEKLKQLLAKVQMAQAGNNLLDFLRQQAAASSDPNKMLSDPKYIGMVQNVTKQAGLPAQQMDPAQTAQQGTSDTPVPAGYQGANYGGSIPGLPTRQAKPAQLDPGFLAPGGSQAFFQKNTQAIEDVPAGAERDAMFQGQVGRAPNPTEEKSLQGLPYQLDPVKMEAVKDKIFGDLNSVVKSSIAHPNPAAIYAAAKSAYSRLMAIPHDPNDPTWQSQVEAEIAPYLSDSLEHLSPEMKAKMKAELAKANKDDYMVTYLQQQLALKQQDDAVLREEREAMASHYREETDQISELLPGKMDKQIADTKRAYAASAQSSAEAKWYVNRVAEDTQNGIPMSPQMQVAAVTALSKNIDSDKQLLGRLNTNLATLGTSGLLTPAERARLAPTRQAIQQQINDITNDLNRSQQQMSQIRSVNPLGGFGSGYTSPFNSFGQNNYDPNASTDTPTPTNPTTNQPEQPQHGQWAGKDKRNGKDVYRNANGTGYVYADGTPAQ